MSLKEKGIGAAGFNDEGSRRAESRSLGATDSMCFDNS